MGLPNNRVRTYSRVRDSPLYISILTLLLPYVSRTSCHQGSAPAVFHHPQAQWGKCADKPADGGNPPKQEPAHCRSCSLQVRQRTAVNDRQAKAPKTWYGACCSDSVSQASESQQPPIIEQIIVFRQVVVHSSICAGLCLRICSWMGELLSICSEGDRQIRHTGPPALWAMMWAGLAGYKPHHASSSAHCSLRRTHSMSW